MSHSPNGILICSDVFAWYIRVTNAETDRHTDHTTYDCGICRNRPPLCCARDAA